jgi:hypothetical protein
MRGSLTETVKNKSVSFENTRFVLMTFFFYIVQALFVELNPPGRSKLITTHLEKENPKPWTPNGEKPDFFRYH